MRIEPKISSTLIDDIGASAAKCSLNFGPEITSDNDRSVVFPFALPRSPSQFEVPSFISFGLGVADVDGARYDVLLFAPIISVQGCVKSDQFAEPLPKIEGSLRASVPLHVTRHNSSPYREAERAGGPKHLSRPHTPLGLGTFLAQANAIFSFKEKSLV